MQSSEGGARLILAARCAYFVVVVVQRSEFAFVRFMQSVRHACVAVPESL